MRCNICNLQVLSVDVMSGCIIDDGLAVNYWAQNQQKILRFLTNIHYCNSKIAMPKDVDQIFTTKINVDVLTQCLEKPLPPIIAFPLNVRFHIDDKKLNLDFYATFIDANYSPGSAMILFEGTKQGNILYTGSFRFTSEMNENPVFKEYIGGQKKLDKIYLDSKYLLPTSVSSLPTKRDVLFTVASIIRNNPAHKIHIAVTRCVKEEVIIALSNLVDEPIWVDQQTLKTLNILSVHSNVANEKTKYRIFIHTLANCSIDESRSQDDIRIILRAQVHTDVYEKLRIQWSQERRVFFFPYSAHSTPNELKEMLEKLKPINIIPIKLSVNNSFAHQFLMNIKSVWTEKLSVAIDKRSGNSAQEEKLHFWKNLGKMERILQSGNFSCYKPSKKISVQQVERKLQPRNFSHCKLLENIDIQQQINGSKMTGKRKVIHNDIYNKKIKVCVNCDKTTGIDQETDRNMNGEHKKTFQRECKECCKAVEQRSKDILNGNYKNRDMSQLSHNGMLTMKTGPKKKSLSVVSCYQMIKDTRQRRKKLNEKKLQVEKVYKEANLKKLCLKHKCTVQVSDIYCPKFQYFSYLGLKPKSHI